MAPTNINNEKKKIACAQCRIKKVKCDGKRLFCLMRKKEAAASANTILSPSDADDFKAKAFLALAPLRVVSSSGRSPNARLDEEAAKKDPVESNLGAEPKNEAAHVDLPQRKDEETNQVIANNFGVPIVKNEETVELVEENNLHDEERTTDVIGVTEDSAFADTVLYSAGAPDVKDVRKEDLVEEGNAKRGEEMQTANAADEPITMDITLANSTKTYEVKDEKESFVAKQCNSCGQIADGFVTNASDLVASNKLEAFRFLIRLANKNGTVGVMKYQYKLGVDSYETVTEAILDWYHSSVEGNVQNSSDTRNKYAVKLKDINRLDSDWFIDIENTQDIEFAIADSGSQRVLRMNASVTRKPHPPLCTVDIDAASNSCIEDDEPLAAVATVIADDGKKRKTVASVTPAKKMRTARKSTSKTGSGKWTTDVRIIRALAELRSLGIANPPRIQASMFAGYSTNKGHFANCLAALKSKGIITYPDKTSVALTDEGTKSEEAKGISLPQSNAEVHLKIKTLLKGKELDIFDGLADGKVRTRNEVAASIGCEPKGHFQNLLSRMKSIGVVQYKKNGDDPKMLMVKLTDMCFPIKQCVNDLSVD